MSGIVGIKLSGERLRFRLNIGDGFGFQYCQ